jgi:hypothetical protein
VDEQSSDGHLLGLREVSKGRLTLVRHVSRSDALVFAANVRRQRFHDPDGVIVVDDQTDEIVIETAAPRHGCAPPAAACEEPR